jgi:hypothetical protein
MKPRNLYRLGRAFRISLLLSLFSPALFAQKNVVKGRAFYLPPFNSLQVFSLGIGLERRIGDDFSLQLLYNRMGSDMTATDGGGTIISAFVPEMRYYFGKKKAISLNKAFFGGLFTEINHLSYLQGGEIDLDAPYTFTEKRVSVNPGLLIGRNTRLSNRWYLEFYIGGKARFIKETSVKVENGTETVTQKQFVKSGMRGGINLGFRF